ncbi:uncharacterized protein M421DRAFT_65543, partial [Didymella exigua CBS 183.55]
APTLSYVREMADQLLAARGGTQRHYSLLPALIINIIRQFKKGADIIVHSQVLLAARVADLEAANRAASEPRRRRSKRRIQKHGVLTKGAGEDILAQNEADQQIAHEERQGGARSGLSQRAQRRCTRCKETGHNSRTCNADTINIE